MKMVICFLLLCIGASVAQAGVDDDARALVQRWVDSQNHGDFAAYRALYGRGFHGVRRSRVAKVELDHDAWISDRARMFKRTMKVTVTDEKVTATPLAVDFVQTFALGSYHDRGRKHLELATDGDHLVIVREELLESLLARSKEPRCVDSENPAVPGLVLTSCLLGQKKLPYGDPETQKKVTLSMKGGATVELGEVGSGWEWEESWRIQGLVLANGSSAVVLVREAATEAGEEYDSHEVRVLSLPTLAPLWTSSQRLLDFHLAIDGGHIDIDAKRAPDVGPKGVYGYDDLMPNAIHLAFDGKQITEK